MTINKLKTGFQFRVNIYSALTSWAAIIFGVIMGSGLFVFFGFALLLVVFLGLRKAIYKDEITRVQHGKHVDIYVNDTLIDSIN